jgi:hypothetical protein
MTSKTNGENSLYLENCFRFFSVLSWPLLPLFSPTRISFDNNTCYAGTRTAACLHKVLAFSARIKKKNIYEKTRKKLSFLFTFFRFVTCFPFFSKNILSLQTRWQLFFFILFSLNVIVVLRVIRKSKLLRQQAGKRLIISFSRLITK